MAIVASYYSPCSALWCRSNTQLFTPQKAKSYTPVQTFEAKQLTSDLLDSPEEFYIHNRRYSASVIMQIIYGHRIPDCIISFPIEVTKGDSEDVRRIYGVLARFGTYRQPGSFLVDQFPALADNLLFDFVSNWRRYGATIHKADAEVYSYYWNKMKNEVEAGTAQHSWGKGFVRSNYEKHGIDELGAAYAAYTSSFLMV